MTEAELAALGIHRIPVPIPFPQAGGPVNVYLVEDAGGGVLMYDAGLGTPDAQAELERGFARAGFAFADVTRIVLSHGHVDHYGAARWVQERAGREVPVVVHPADASKVAETGRRWPEVLPLYTSYLARLGVPPEAVEATGKGLSSDFGMARRLPAVEALVPGQVLETRHLALEVQHMPGHTPGLCCLYAPRERLFLSADHLLEKVSPNPLIDLGPDGAPRYRPLVAYVESVQRLRALDVALVLPGHGPPFSGHRAVIDGLLAFYGKRQRKILDALAGGPLTGYEVTRILFPWAGVRELFLVVSEAVANLEALEARGEVLRVADGERFLFRRA